jgi:uncharacterized protein YuzE
MKIRVDKANDVLYFRLDENRIVESEEIQPGVILDYDEKNQVVGIELLGISKRTSIDELSSIHFQAA